jgi:hypothetical protein
MACSVLVEGGATVNNETVYPMLCLASDPDNTYVPHAMTNRELTEKLAYQEYTDGTYGFKCVKSGNVCTASFEESSNITENANTQIGSPLPEQFRPKIQVSFPDSNTKKRIILSTSGKFTCSEALTNASIRGAITYICLRV